MSKTVIRVENLYKEYHLGNIGYGTLREDLSSWWAKLRGLEDPNSVIGHTNVISKKLSDSHFLAINDVSFDVKEGDALGIVGKNGAGKSTLLKLLSRITNPTSGSIKVKGRISSLLEVGTGFHPELTGRENIYLNGAILGMKKSEIEKKMDEIIDFSGIERFIDTPVKRYSSGMYVRLAFAVSAHLDSDILILDEVLAVGDAEFQKKCLGKMDDVTRNQGRTILFVSHNMNQVKTLCTSGVLLEKGSVKLIGSMDQIIESYSQVKVTSEKIKIEERTDRKGDGSIRITDMKMYNSSNEQVDSIAADEKIRLRVFFDSKHNDIVNQFKINLGIENFIGSRVAFASTENDAGINKYTINNILKKGYIDFDFDKINLIPGNYTIVFFCMSNEVISDWIDKEAFTFNIKETDYYNIGKVVYHNEGFIQLDYRVN